MRQADTDLTCSPLLFGMLGRSQFKSRAAPYPFLYNWTMSSTLERLAAAAVKDGWASGSDSIDQIRRSAERLGWSEIAIRRTDSPVTLLRPLDAGQAKPNSLSSRYGKGAQPLHTDGAHLREPPDLVLLSAEATSTIPTLLWKRRIIDFQRSPYNGMEHGIFLVENGAESFFCAAQSGRHLRYDPGCMTACDERSRNVAHFFATAIEASLEHHWDEPGKILLIDNRQALHARAAADEEPHRELKRVAFRMQEGTP
jgi:Taurine catabolism dioxygenase TauD, TfdA family